ncbi:MAG TPA: dolichyl-phosphate beta-glucosyltransferase [Bryobacteraceae bacterium]|nr:dolichyl-phosphate beta-glucosyltransferase [Bryobacteraceae bacterium]
MDSLSIVIPAYNEERRLPETLDRILEWLQGQHPSFGEVIVVDDGSTDGTAGMVEEYGRTHSSVRLLRNPGNRGKGYAVRNGMLAATGSWILSTDADLSTPIAEVSKLFSAALENEAVIAIGSRAVDRSLVEVHQPALREYSGRFFNLLMRAVTGLPFRDTQCGFKLFRNDAAKRIFPLQKQDGFSFDVEDLVIARKLGLRTVEVAVRWRNAEGTKVGFMQGVKSFGDLFRIRADHRGG